MTETTRRTGFILLGVLWIIAGVAALALVIALTARADVAAAQNRRDMTRTRWLAEGCAERARSAADSALRATSDLSATWAYLDSVVATSQPVAECDVRLEAAGARRNINATGEDELRRLFLLLEETPARAESLADAVLDWRDTDDESRPSGAEREWYAANGRPGPRNAVFAAIAEVHQVRGLESDGRIDSLFSVEPSRLVLGQAREASLLALPGMTAEAVDAIVAARQRGRGTVKLDAIIATLSAPARAEAMAHYQLLAMETTSTPDAWILTVEEHVGVPPIKAMVEERLSLAGHRVAVTRERGMP